MHRDQGMNQFKQEFLKSAYETTGFFSRLPRTKRRPKEADLAAFLVPLEPLPVPALPTALTTIPVLVAPA